VAEPFDGRSMATGNGGLPQGSSFVIGVGFFVAAALLLTVPFTTYVVDLVMGLVILLVPTWYGVLRVQAGKFDYFESFYPFSALYFMYFGWSSIYLKYNVQDLQYRSLLPWLTPALATALAGYIAMTLGYMAFFRRARVGRLARYRPTGVGFLLLVVSLGFLGQVSTSLQQWYFHSTGKVDVVVSIGQQFAPLFFLAWFFLWHQLFSGRLPRVQRTLLLSFFLPAAASVLLLLVGGKERAILIFALPALGFWYARRKLPWHALLVVLLVAVFVIFPLYNSFQHLDRRLGTAERLNRTVASISHWDRQNFLDQSVGAFFKRMGIITSVAAVLRDVPDFIPYRKGETLALAPISLLIPRFLWPEKPNINIGREFGVTFNLVNPVDRETQIAPSLVGEFYWNFGMSGVIVGMFIMGIVYRWIFQAFGAYSGYDPLGKAVYIMLFLKMIHFEGNFAGLVAGSLRSLVIIYLLAQASLKLGLLGQLESEA